MILVDMCPEGPQVKAPLLAKRTPMGYLTGTGVPVQHMLFQLLEGSPELWAPKACVDHFLLKAGHFGVHVNWKTKIIDTCLPDWAY